MALQRITRWQSLTDETCRRFQSIEVKLLINIYLLNYKSRRRCRKTSSPSVLGFVGGAREGVPRRSSGRLHQNRRKDWLRWRMKDAEIDIGRDSDRAADDLETQLAQHRWAQAHDHDGLPVQVPNTQPGRRKCYSLFTVSSRFLTCLSRFS